MDIVHNTDGTHAAISYVASAVTNDNLGSATTTTKSLLLTPISRGPGTPTASTTRSLSGSSISVSSNDPGVYNSGPAITSYTYQVSTTSSTSGFGSAQAMDFSTRSASFSATPTQGYWFTVTATSSAGSATSSAVYSYPYPSLPTSVSATPNMTAAGEIDVSWNPPTYPNGVTSYTLYMEDTSGDGGALPYDTYSSSITGVAITGLTPGVQYNFFVTASNDYGTSPQPSSWPTNAIAGGLAPTSPQSVTASASTNTQGVINLSWTAPASLNGILTSYTIYKASDNSVVGTTTGTNYAVNSLTAGTSYQFYVKATNSYGLTSSASSSTTSVMAPGIPSAPGSLSVSVSTTQFGSLIASWSAPSVTAGGITGYIIYSKNTVTGALTQLGTASGTVVTLSSLAYPVAYNIVVVARNAFGDSQSPVQYSPQSTAVTATTAGPPEAPTGLTADTNVTTFGAIDLSWTAPVVTNGTITGYSIYTTSGAPVASTTGTGTTYTVTGLSANTTYSFVVRARNAVSDVVGVPGAPSNIASANTTGLPIPPTNVVVVASSATIGRLSISWTASTSTVTGYKLYMSTDGGATKTLVISTLVGTSYVMDNLDSGLSYLFYVKSRNLATDTSGNDTADLSLPSTGASSPLSYSTQSIANTTVTNVTNTALSGTYSITATASDRFSFTSPSGIATVADTAVPSGTISNLTNTALTDSNAPSGNVITVLSSNVFTYTTTSSGTVASASIPTGSGSLVNLTNKNIFNGTKTLTSGTGMYALTYTIPSTTFASATASGIATNTSNTAFNAVNVPIISTPTTRTFTYSSTGTLASADLGSTYASGVVVNKTNSTLFTGTYNVTVPVNSYNTLTYTVAKSNSVLYQTSTSSICTLEVAATTNYNVGDAITVANLVGAQYNGSVKVLTGVSTSSGTTYLTYVNSTPASTQTRTASATNATVTPAVTTASVGPIAATYGGTATSTTCSVLVATNSDFLVGQSVTVANTGSSRFNASGATIVAVTSNTSIIVSGTTYSGTLITYTNSGTPTNVGSVASLIGGTITSSGGISIGTPYGAATKTTTTSTLSVNYRSGWIG
jgi:hypothetical protein